VTSAVRDHHVLPARTAGVRFIVLGAALLSCGILLGLWIGTSIDAANARDLSLNTWFHDGADEPGLLRSISTFVSWIGAGSVIAPIELTFVLWLLVFRRWRWAVFAFVSALGGHVLSNLTKHIVERPRPPWFILEPGQSPLDFPSFPSGHTTSGMTGLVAIAITLWFVLPRPWSTIVAPMIGVIGVFQGPSRLLLAKHWVTDVFGGLLFGGGWLLLVWGVFLLWLAPRRHPDAGEVAVPVATPSSDRAPPGGGAST